MILDYCQCETLCLYGGTWVYYITIGIKEVDRVLYKDGIYVGDRFIRTEIVNMRPITT